MTSPEDDQSHSGLWSMFFFFFFFLLLFSPELSDTKSMSL